MNNTIKTILISSIVIFALGFFAVPSAKAQNGLIVEYWSGNAWLPLSGPIFNETNFLPGDGVTRLIRVTNNSGQAQRIATEAINENDPDDFALQLDLTIKEGTTIIFNNTLAQFFSQGETYLSDLANGAQTQYDFTIAFKSGTEDSYQGKILGFDILIGFQGTEGGLTLPLPGSGNGGGLPPGLVIFNEGTEQIADAQATITWTTTYESTSWVIYAAQGETYSFNLSLPNYGYPQASLENPAKVANHSVTITGLTPNTVYHYRCVSHASLAVSVDHSFTTLETAVEQSNEETEMISETTGQEQSGQSSKEDLISQANSAAPPVAGESFPEEITTGERQESANGTSEEEPENLNKSLAAISSFFELRNLWWLLIIIILILFFLFFLRKKKNEN